VKQIEARISTKISTSVRARQLSGMFDVPATDRHDLAWSVPLPLDRDWHVGLIVGPSGSGKTTLLRAGFGDPIDFAWTGDSVIDCFDEADSIERIAKACSAVGFNTIPAWLRPFSVLSGGEQFRATIARALLDTPADRMVVLDEFTSVVDRQVAKIGASAVAKWVRRDKRQLVAASCHYDIVDWLQPDWIIDAAAQTFEWRSVQPRPTIDVEIATVDHATWQLFAPFHYLTAELHRGARCFALFAEGEPAAFAGLLRRPHASRRSRIMGVSRLVTLPDWQGLGLAFVLVDALGAAYGARAERVRTYPAHPALIHGFDRSPRWKLVQKPGYMGSGGNTRFRHGANAKLVGEWRHGTRPCAVFEYVGAIDRSDAAAALLDEAHRTKISA
jgi:GNAT superfamily N-acetyltransferase